MVGRLREEMKCLDVRLTGRGVRVEWGKDGLFTVKGMYAKIH